MNGLEISRGYYETYGKPMLGEKFNAVLPYIAVGLVGSGSERFGYDDEVSRDHDFEPGFCIFLPDESIVDSRTEFLLMRAYDKLPQSYGGVTRARVSPVGGRRNGPIRTADFYTEKVGSSTGELTTGQWLTLPDSALAEATNGEVFFDGYGEFSRIRARLSAMPDDVRLKKIAGNILIMAQSGQYNYSRCLSHGEPEAAQTAVSEFCRAAAQTLFLLRKRYMPFYKWVFRAMRDLQGGAEFAAMLGSLLSGDIYDKQTCAEKAATVERLCAVVVAELKTQGLTKAECADLEKHAYSVNDGIKDAVLRNAHILAGI